MTKRDNIEKIQLDEYRKRIERLARSKASMVFLNSGKEHAAIVMGNIFKHSVENVRIFAGDLNGNVSDDTYYQENLSQFLNNGGKLKVLLQNYNEEEKPRIFKLFNSVDFFYPENVEIKLAKDEVIDENNNTVHFTVGDNSMYRLENDTINYFASGSFNDKENSQHLIKLFDDIYEKSSVQIM